MADPIVFLDSFERTDESPLATGGWTSSNVQITNGSCTAVAASAAYAIQATTVPSTANQVVRALVASNAEGASQIVAIAGRCAGTAASPSSGYRLSLTWGAAGARTAKLQKYNRASPGSVLDLTSATVTLVTSNTSDLRVMQELRLTITDTPRGVLLNGYVNQDNDETPTITFTDLGRDSGGAGYTPTHKTAGSWMFFFTTTGVSLELFEGKDYFTLEKYNPYAGRTLKQLRDSVLVLVDRTSSSNFQAASLNQFINDAQEEVLIELGDLALFARTEETMTLSSVTNDRTFLPSYVERVERIAWPTDGSPVRWTYRDLDASGLPSIQIDPAPGSSGSDYLVTYYKRATELVSDTDRTIVPRWLDEAVVAGAARRVAEQDSDARFSAAMEKRFAELIHRGKKHGNRLLRQSAGRFHVPINRRHPMSRYAPTWQLGSYWPY